MRRLVAAVGSYTDSSGREKTRWMTVGALVPTKKGGEVVLLDPAVSLSGLYALQRASGHDGDRVMLQVFSDDRSRSSTRGEEKGDGEVPF